MNGQRVKANETGLLGVAIGDQFRQPPDGWRPTVGVIFDDGGSGCIRVSALTTVDGQMSDPSAIARAIEQSDETTLSGLAGHYDRSPFTTVTAWLASFGQVCPGGRA